MGACHLCRWRNVAYARPQRSYRMGHAEVHSTSIRYGIPDCRIWYFVLGICMNIPLKLTVTINRPRCFSIPLLLIFVHPVDGVVRC